MVPLDDTTLNLLLEDLQEQRYPLQIELDTAEALVECFRRVLEAVPEDDQVYVRADFELASKALLHPSTAQYESVPDAQGW